MTEKFLNQINPANVFIVGASQGIGLGFVKKLLQDSRITKIYATYRSVDSAEKLLLIENQYPDKLTCLSMDITQEMQIANCCQIIQNQVQKLHLVVNCVGFLHDSTQQPEKSLKHLNIDNLTRYFQVNSIGGALLAKHLVPLFKHQDQSIFASISAKVGSIGDNYLGGWYGYRASKAALNMLMRNVSIEYGRVCPRNIVVTLHPGTTDTNLSRPFQRNVTPEKLFSVEKTVSQLLEVIEGLQAEDSGEFFSWDGTKLPW
jgi:NAD(P)-dependent dehydrogenase (short-subunit alcohol dehydrogenase family)